MLQHTCQLYNSNSAISFNIDQWRLLVVKTDLWRHWQLGYKVSIVVIFPRTFAPWTYVVFVSSFLGIRMSFIGKLWTTSVANDNFHVEEISDLLTDISDWHLMLYEEFCYPRLMIIVVIDGALAERGYSMSLILRIPSVMASSF